MTLLRYFLFTFVICLAGCGSESANVSDSTGERAGEGVGEKSCQQHKREAYAGCDLMTADYTVTPIELSSGAHIEEGPYWTVDGEKLVLVNNLQGWEYDVNTGAERCLTCDFDEPAEVHRFYQMVDGSYIMAGPSNETEEAGQQLHEALTRTMGDELWWMPADLSAPPVALGSRVFEGFAVSRDNMKISWSNSPVQGEFINPGSTDLSDAANMAFSVYVADLAVDGNVASLENIKIAYQTPTYFIEVQDFLPCEDRLAVSTYWSLEKRLTPSDPVGVVQLFVETGGYINLIDIDAEAWTIDIDSGEIVNQSQAPDTYDEFEGVHPNGVLSTIETTRGDGGWSIALLELDTDGKKMRLFDREKMGPVADMFFHPNGKTMAGAHGFNTEPDRVIVTRPRIALVDFHCP